jgi:hypothetical protein
MTPSERQYDTRGARPLKPRLATFVCLLGCVVLTSELPDAQAPPPASPDQLYEEERWFELREAIRGAKATPLLEGAVASAFNDARAAERLLTEAIRVAPDVAAANEARSKLTMLYLRMGRSSDAGRQIDAIVKTEPRSDIQNVRAVFGAHADRPNFQVSSQRTATIRCEVDRRGVHVPLTVNGKEVTWLLDTGANVTVISDAEAALVGIPQAADVKLNDLAGGTAAARSAIAARLTIGGTRMQDMPLLVLPQSQAPFNDLPAGRRGILGLPAILALQSIRWTSRGGCQTGFPSTSSDESNLVFNNLFPLTRVGFGTAQLTFVLDTGNQDGTQLWERFGRDFAPLVAERGTKGVKRVTQVGGATDHEVAVLPEIALRVGGQDAWLRPANVFSRPVGDDRRHGNLGMDILSQATEVSIDFRSMVLTLR